MTLLDDALLTLKNGETVALSTDTVWGIAADPRNPAAIERLYQQKQRPGSKALQLLCDSPGTACQFVAPGLLQAGVWSRLEQLWPGALTLVVPAAPTCPPRLVADGKVGLRVPASLQARELLSLSGGALAASSLNLSGQPAARTYAEAAALQLADHVLPGEDAPGAASTVYDLELRQVLRAGALPLVAIEAALCLT